MMKKRPLNIVLVALMALGLSFAGLHNAQSRALTLRFATFGPPKDINSIVMADWAKKVEEATEGKIRIQIYYSQSLVKIPEMLDGVTSGTTDIAFMTAVPFPERLPLTQLLGLPTLSFSKSENAAMAWWTLYKKYPEFQKEYTDKGLKVIWICAPGPNQIEGIVDIKKMEDLNGLRAGVETREETNAFSLFGAAAVTLQGGDMYTSLERGVIQTSSQNVTGSIVWKTHQIAPYFTENIDMNFRPCPIVISQKSYDKIPDDLKPVFDKASDGEYWSRRNGRIVDETTAKNHKVLVEYHQKHGDPGVYALPEEEKEKLRKLAMPINETWAEEMEAKGLPGKAILADYLEMAKTN